MQREFRTMVSTYQDELSKYAERTRLKRTKSQGKEERMLCLRRTHILAMFQN